MQIKKFEIDFCGRPLTAEFSDLAEQANGSVMVKYGETIVMATAVTTDSKKEGLEHFPLTVDYEENCDLELIVCGKGDKINMIEGKANEAPEAIVLGALESAIPEIQKLIEFQN